MMTIFFRNCRHNNIMFIFVILFDVIGTVILKSIQSKLTNEYR